MLMYEGFLNKMLEMIPEFKIAKIFVNFLNSVNPELECYYIQSGGLIWVCSDIDELISINLSLAESDSDIQFFSHHEELTDDIIAFFKYIFDTSIVSVDMKKKKVLDVMKNLTKDNFEIFRKELELQNNTKKYNL